ncbi:MAG: HEAT repeat domain-containing protein [Kofleriaceae bacterium]
MSAVFLHAGLAALDEAGDPTTVRSVLVRVLAGEPPPPRAVRPKPRKKRIEWAADQLAFHATANDAARAYRALCELVWMLFEPLALARPAPPPAPEVAAALAVPALLDAILAPPRVLARDLATTSDRDVRRLLADPDPGKRTFGLRSIRHTALTGFIPELAAIIACDPELAVRTEALRICSHARVRAKLGAALLPHTTGTTRATAVEALHALRVVIPEDRLLALLGDPEAPVRAAAARAISLNHSPAIGAAAITAMADDDPAVRTAALAAVARSPVLHDAALVQPLCTIARSLDGDVRPAIYVLGKLRGFAPELVDATLRECVLGLRSDSARAATLLLQQLGVAVPEPSIDQRMLRAARELTRTTREERWAGVLETKRLATTSLVPALHALGDRVAVEDPLDRELLAHVCEVLRELGVAVNALPRPPHLDSWQGTTPVVRALHGAYAIADAGSAAGLWDNRTGAVLFAIPGAKLLELVPGRAELAVIRVDGERWLFERHAVPTGARLASLAIPGAFTHGTPATLSVAADLATVWCDHRHAPYRFHIKLGDPADRLLDDEPNLGRRAR